jgi:UDPglucose--hexose-1-phosphate uridylyltransferase
LCPDGERVSGIKNAAYTACFVFDNDHPAFKASAPAPAPAPGIYQSAQAAGLCRVLCYTPDHGGRLSRLSEHQFKGVVRCWRDQTDALMADAGYEHVFIFENNGEVVGVSNPHPHCQIYATPFVFQLKTTTASRSYHISRSCPMRPLLSQKGRGNGCLRCQSKCSMIWL